MPYTVNPHRHVKIWLSLNRDLFLNIENQLRLVRMRDTNPMDEINFVYDSDLLCEKALAELRSFCKKHRIHPIDMRDVVSQCTTIEEKDLIALYENERTHLQEGGNIAVCSDIIRWLKPIYSQGIYSDFDVEVDTSKLPEYIMVDSGLLFNIGSLTQSCFYKKYDLVVLNNDTIMVADCDAALGKIQAIQRDLYAACAHKATNAFANFIDSMFKNCGVAFGGVRSLILQTQIQSNMTTTMQLKRIKATYITARETRQAILDATKDNHSFAIFNLQSESNLIKFLRAKYKTLSSFIGRILLPTNIYQQIKQTALIKNDQEFLTKIRLENRLMLLKESVMYTSGPGIVGKAIFPNLIYTDSKAFDKEIAPLSLAHYGLDKAFKSKNSASLHDKNIKRLLSASVGEFNDLSWLTEGQQAICSREEKITQSTLKIQKFYRTQVLQKKVTLPSDFFEIKQEIESHIKKISSQLNGCFGFYRSTQRKEKINALNKILALFDENSFNLHAFKEQIKDFKSAAIFASIGKSHTQTLIERIHTLARQAAVVTPANNGFAKVAKPPLN